MTSLDKPSSSWSDQDWIDAGLSKTKVWFRIKDLSVYGNGIGTGVLRVFTRVTGEQILCLLNHRYGSRVDGAAAKYVSDNMGYEFSWSLGGIGHYEAKDHAAAMKVSVIKPKKPGSKPPRFARNGNWIQLQNFKIMCGMDNAVFIAVDKEGLMSEPLIQGSNGCWYVYRSYNINEYMANVYTGAVVDPAMFTHVRVLGYVK